MLGVSKHLMDVRSCLLITFLTLVPMWLSFSLLSGSTGIVKMFLVFTLVLYVAKRHKSKKTQAFISLR